MHALVGDLLPVLIPGGTVDPDAQSVLLPLDDGRARVSTSSLLDACADQPNHLWPRLVDEWLRALREQANATLNAGPSPRLDRLRVRTPYVRGGHTHYYRLAHEPKS